MKAYEIIGPTKMSGKINIQGSKNSALAIICAALLAKDVIVLNNVPHIQDIDELLHILKKINVSFSFNHHQLILDSSNITYQPLLFDEIKHFRASYYFIGVFLALFSKVKIYLPGGCKIGKRPIDQHLKGLRKMNVQIQMDEDVLSAKSACIMGNEIELDVASVGATINLLLTSVFANKVTMIKNAAKEPEIVDLAKFLRKMGVHIIGDGTSTIIINPVQKKLKAIKYKIMSDRIVSGTYLLYGALLADRLTLNHFNVQDNEALIHVLISLGARMDIRENKITIYRLKSFKNAFIRTDVFPGFPTDLQQIITTFLFFGQGLSIVEENVFEDRFLFLDQLQKMGGKYFKIHNKVLIYPSKLNSAILKCDDLRGGAALLLAAMLTNDTCIIKNVEYIERGYEDIVKVLQSVHVNIKEINLYEA